MTEAEWTAFLQRPEIPAFNRAMLANPDDDLPRLVFADWVEENHSHRRFVKQLRLSVSRAGDLLHCPAFPESRGLHAGLWRGRLALDFRPVAGIEVRLLREEMDFLRVVLSSGWLGRIRVWVHGVDGVVTSPECVDWVCWPDIEWLEIGGHIDWQPAIWAFVLSEPTRFPKLSTLVQCGDTASRTEELERWLSSPVVQQLKRFDLGYGRRWPEVVDAVRRSPHLSAELKAQMQATDEGGANR